MKHILTSHFVNDKNKDGKPFRTKDGKPFKKVTIKVNKTDGDPKEYDDQYISSLVFNDDDRSLFWQVGEEVDLVIEKNGDFWNFRQPSKYDLLESRVKVLEDFMKGDLPAEDIKREKEEEDEYPDIVTANDDFEDVPPDDEDIPF